MSIYNDAFINSNNLTLVGLGVALNYDKLPGETGNIKGEPYGTETHEILPRRDAFIIYLLSMLFRFRLWVNLTQ
jgi:hypothetical protein